MKDGGAKADTASSTHSLVATGHVDKAAIVSAAGDSIWAKSEGFEVRRPFPQSDLSRCGPLT
jgi:hypothetical protein